MDVFNDWVGRSQSDQTRTREGAVKATTKQKCPDFTASADIVILSCSFRKDKEEEDDPHSIFFAKEGFMRRDGGKHDVGSNDLFSLSSSSQSRLGILGQGGLTAEWPGKSVSLECSPLQ